MWPKTKLDILRRLEMATEALSESEVPEEAKDEEANTETKKEPEEYNGIDPLTWTEIVGDEEKHFRIL